MPFSINNTVQKLLANYAITWIGVKEIGKNNGFANASFEKLMKTVGWYNSAQWCMFFAKMVHYNTFKKDQKIINKILDGNSQKAFQNATNDKTGTYKTVTKNPQIGDIIVFTHRNNKATGHVGIVIKVIDDKNVETIEGNTSDKSIGDGDLVAKKIRPYTLGASLGKKTDLYVKGLIRKINML